MQMQTVPWRSFNESQLESLYLVEICIPQALLTMSSNFKRHSLCGLVQRFVKMLNPTRIRVYWVWGLHCIIGPDVLHIESYIFLNIQTSSINQTSGLVV